MRKKIYRTAFHIVGGCFLLSGLLGIGCDSTPRPPVIEKPHKADSLDLTGFCVLTLKKNVIDVEYRDTVIHCSSMENLDSVLIGFGAAALDKKLAFRWEPDVLYGRVDSLFKLMQKDSIINYRNLNNLEGQ